jgi:hypothetical protein
MTTINRNDISIHVMQDGSCYICQGNPARQKLQSNNPNNLEILSEHNLYHSQIKHRCIIRLLDKSIEIIQPSQAPKIINSKLNLYPVNIKAGAPIYMGTI